MTRISPRIKIRRRQPKWHREPRGRVTPTPSTHRAAPRTKHGDHLRPHHVRNRDTRSPPLASPARASRRVTRDPCDVPSSHALTLRPRVMTSRRRRLLTRAPFPPYAPPAREQPRCRRRAPRTRGRLPRAAPPWPSAPRAPTPSPPPSRRGPARSSPGRPPRCARRASRRSRRWRSRTRARGHALDDTAAFLKAFWEFRTGDPASFVALTVMPILGPYLIFQVLINKKVEVRKEELAAGGWISSWPSAAWTLTR